MILLKILALGIILACFVELCRKCGHVLADADEMYGRWWLVLFAIVLIAPAADARPHLFNRRPTQAIDAPQADPPQRTHSLLPRRSAAGSNSSANTLSQPAAPSRAPKAPAETQGCDCDCKDCTGRPGCPCKCKDCRCNAKQTKCDCATTGVCTCGDDCRCENCPKHKHAAQRPDVHQRSGPLRRLLHGGPLAWLDFNPRGCKNDCGIYDDVRSRAPNTPWYPDAATRCHEWTHLVNGRISVQYHACGFYASNGRAVVLRKPRLLLPEVAKYVTQYQKSFRDRFVDGWIAASHRNDPLDILDEFSAYTNDLQCQREKHMAWQGTEDQLRHHCHYADALIAAVKEHDPDYPDLDKLTAFVDYQQDRAQKLIDSRPHANHHASYQPPRDAKLDALTWRDWQDEQSVWTWLALLWPVRA